jgi:hypothetical protein
MRNGRAGSSFADCSTVKMEAIRSSETSVHTRSTRRHIPGDGILHSHRRENLKSYKDNSDDTKYDFCVKVELIFNQFANSTPKIVQQISVKNRHRIYFERKIGNESNKNEAHPEM